MLLMTICWLLPEGAWPIAQSNTNIKYSRKTSYLPTLLLELRECLSEVHSQVALDVQWATLEAVRTKCESANTVTGIPQASAPCIVMYSITMITDVEAAHMLRKAIIIWIGLTRFGHLRGSGSSRRSGLGVQRHGRCRRRGNLHPNLQTILPNLHMNNLLKLP